jgi:hypothetical protein
MFPKLIDQSQFNRRTRALRLLVEQLCRYWIIQKGWNRQTFYLMDTKPVRVLGYKRNKKRSDFLGKAGKGVYVSRNLKYFGFKLVAISTMRGVPVLDDLVPANSDERLAAETIIDQISGCDLFTDKGFIGLE